MPLVSRHSLRFAASVLVLKAALADPFPAIGVEPQVPSSGSTGAQPGAAGSGGSAGAVQGVVEYKADASRSWKLSRYYLQGATGTLAESVVALEGGSLGAFAPSAPLQTQAIDQVSFQFVPETTAVRAGDSVRISNEDDALHNVMTSDGGRPFNVNVVKGQEFIHTFDHAGGLAEPIRLGCVFHGGMRAWIYVFDHPWFKVTGRDGRFFFEHVPPGRYTLAVVHPAGKLRWSRQVEVKPNETTPAAILLSPDDLIGSKNKSD